MDDRSTLLARAQHALVEKRHDDAVSLLEDCAARDPNCVDTHSLLATAYAAKGDYAKCLTSFERVLAIEPSPKAHYNVAAIHKAQGNLLAARAALQSALQFDPGYSKARDLLAQIGPNGSPSPSEPPMAVEWPPRPVAQPEAAPAPGSVSLQTQPYRQPASQYPSTPYSAPTPAYTPLTPSSSGRDWGKTIGGLVMVAIPAILVWMCWTGVLLRFVSPLAAVGLGFAIAAMLLAWFCSTRGDFETIHWIAAVVLHGLLFAWVPWMAAKGYNIAYEGWYGV